MSDFIELTDIHENCLSLFKVDSIRFISVNEKGITAVMFEDGTFCLVKESYDDVRRRLIKH